MHSAPEHTGPPQRRADAPSRGPKRPSRFSAGVRAGALVVVVLLGAELLLRNLLGAPAENAPDPLMGSRLVPGRILIESREGYSRSQVNELGLLDDGIDPEARFRIVVVGDSYVEARHVPLQHRFTEILEAQLDRVDVLNAGFAGWVPAKYAIWLREHHEQLQPDLAIVVLNDRDIDELDDGESTPRRVLREAMSKSALLTWTVRRTRLLIAEEDQRLARRGLTPPNAEASGHQDSESARLERHVAKLRAIDRTLQATGVQIIYLQVPRIDCTPLPVRRTDEYAARVMKCFAAESGINLIDPYDCLVEVLERAGEPAHGFHNFMIGEGHLNRRGHRALAELLTETLTEQLP